MSKYLIIVEGKADITFLRDYLKFLNSKLKVEKDEIRKKKQLIIKSENIEIKILIGGGYTSIKKLNTQIERHIKNEYKILVIQDADNPIKDKDNGGVENRLKYLEQIKSDLNITFETFLFPNHKDDGDLETLLLPIVDIENYNKAFICYKSYTDCLTHISKQEFINQLLEDKNKIFNYFMTYYGMENSKEENREYIEKYWNFNSDKLKPLQDFFLKKLK